VEEDRSPLADRIQKRVLAEKAARRALRVATVTVFQACFVASKDHPVIYSVSGASDKLLANGCYLKTSFAFNQFPVYAQLNHGLVSSEAFHSALIRKITSVYLSFPTLKSQSTF
jgi:hypothetical protein